MKWVKRILLIVSILAVVAGAIWTMDWLGIFKVKRILASIPIINNFVTVDQKVYSKVYTKGDKSGSQPVSGLEQVLQRENEGLKQQNDNLKKQVAQAQKAQQDWTAKRVALEQQIASQKAGQAATQTSAQGTTQGTTQQPSTPEDKFKQLAKYYAEMKPKDAVNTMNLLPDNIVLGILTKLDSDQTAKILAAMDPKKAATLVAQMAQ